MALGIGALLGIQAGAQAAGALTRGVGGALAARQLFTKEDKERLAELERMKEEGTLGATEEELARIEGMGAAQRGAMLRQQEAQSAREAAMRGPAVSGRDIFLREQAAATMGQQATEAIRTAMTEADIQAKAAQEAEIEALRDARAQRRAATVQSLLGGAAGGVEAAGTLAAQQAQMEFQREMQLAELEAAPTTEELLRALRGAGQQTDPYGGRL